MGFIISTLQEDVAVSQNVQVLQKDIGPAEEAEKQFKVLDKHLENKSVVTSVLSPKPNSVKLIEYLKQVPDNDLNYFIACLLPIESAAEVVKDIRLNSKSKADNVMKICESFLKEKDASWGKVYEALKDAECYDLADMVKTEMGTYVQLVFNVACMCVILIQA